MSFDSFSFITITHWLAFLTIHLYRRYTSRKLVSYDTVQIWKSSLVNEGVFYMIIHQSLIFSIGIFHEIFLCWPWWSDCKWVIVQYLWLIFFSAIPIIVIYMLIEYIVKK